LPKSELAPIDILRQLIDDIRDVRMTLQLNILTRHHRDRARRRDIGRHRNARTRDNDF